MGGIISVKQAPTSPYVVTFRFISAAATGRIKDMRKILDSGVSVNTRDWSGRSALHLASAEGQLEAVKFLLERGADISARDKRGIVPLAEATLEKRLAVVETLEAAGAKLSEDNLAAIRLFAKNHVDNANSAASTCSEFTDDSISRTNSQVRELGEISKQKNNRTLRNHASFAIMEAFPKTIAVAMIQGQDIAPIDRDMVSLFFSDIAGFTTLSSYMSPEKVSRMLVRLFARFDQIAHIHGVQKVDMIGDAYIAATNLLEDQPDDHAARLAHFACDISAAAASTPVDEDDPDGPLGYVRLRVGLHCGPVSAQVVTAGAMRYTLFGESVHIAATMESSGTPGRVQCSDAFSRLVSQQAHDFQLVLREGKVKVKNMGDQPVQAYWLTSMWRQKRRQGSMNVRAAGDLLVCKVPGRCPSGGATRTSSSGSGDDDGFGRTSSMVRSTSLSTFGFEEAP